MKKLIIFIFYMTAVAVNGQRTPFNLEGIMARDVAHKTTAINQYQKWKNDPAVPSAYIDDKIQLLTDLFIRTAPDTVIVLEHNTMNEWYVRVQYTRSDADAETYTVDASGKIINKIRPFTGIVKGSDDGSFKIFKVVDKIDPEVDVEHVTQILASGEEGQRLQHAVDQLLSKF